MSSSRHPTMWNAVMGRRRPKKTKILLYGGLTLIWLLLWGYHLRTIGNIPAGLFHDEAFNALDALHLQDMHWPVFLTGNFGREPLLVYLMRGAFTLFGPTMWSVRLPVTLAWGLTMPAFWWLTRELVPGDDEREWAGAASLLLLMTSLWYAITAHYAIRTNLFVLLETLFVAALWRAWNRNSALWGGVTGFFWGFAFYTYLANRLLPLIFLGFLVGAFIWRRDAVRARWRPLLLAPLVAGLVMLPLLWYFAHHPQDFLTRTSQVALVGGQGQATTSNRALALLENGRRIAGMFFLRGDTIPWSNIPGRPVFTWFALPIFLAGLLSSLGRQRARWGFVLLWLGVMLLPTLLTEHAPHFQRAVGAIPPVMLLMGGGTAALVRWGKERGAPRLWPFLIVLLLMGESVAGVNAFARWASLPDLYYAFDEGLTRIARYIVTHPAQNDVIYLTPRDVSHPTLRFFLETGGVTSLPRSFDGRSVLVLTPGQDARYIVITHEDFRFPLMAPWLWPEGGYQPVETFRDRTGKLYAQVVHVPAGTPTRQPQWRVTAEWQDHIKLLGADPIRCCRYRPGEILYLQLWWTPKEGPPKHRWTVFTHLLDAQGQQVSGKDCEPGCGSYPTTQWREGELIIAEYQIPLPASMSPGEYTLEVGLYDWTTGRRLPLENRTGDAVVLGHIQIGPDERGD